MTRVLFAVLALVLLAACAKMLGIKPQESKPFEHHAHAVKGVNCSECHAGIHHDGELQRATHFPSTAVCVKCHAKPHDTHECSGCHGLAYVRQNAQLAIDTLKFEHSTHVKRAKGECVHCHQGVTRDSDQIRPPMALCLSCHEHQNDFATRTCDRCHKDMRGENVRPASHVIHDGDWLREHGTRAMTSRDLCATCHTDTSCAECHGRTVAILPEKMHFDDPLRVGVHRAGFKSRHSLEASAQPGLCTTCHTTQTCDGCHAERGVRAVAGGAGGRSPHPPGWVGLRGEGNGHGRAAWRDPAVCASCHSGAGEQLCIGCHRVGGVGGNPHRPGWTSKMRKTVDLPCRQCHGGSP
jgi:hypothetical protein